MKVGQWTLGDLREALSKVPDHVVFPIGFDDAYSYRGDYAEAAVQAATMVAMRRLSRAAGWEDIVYEADLCTCGHDRGIHYRGCMHQEPEKRERVMNANGITYQVLITPPGPECPCEKFELDESVAHAEVVVGDVPPREGNSAQRMADKWGWNE